MLKKYTTHKFLLFGAMTLGLGLSSCNLDREPTNLIRRERTMDSYEDALRWRNGSIRAILRGNMWNTPIQQDVQSDELNATLDYGNTIGLMHFWENFVADNTDSAEPYINIYSYLTDVNYILEHMPGLAERLDDATQKAGIQRILGEAYFFRSFLYLNLALRYAKPYKTTTASTDLSVPLLLKFDHKALPPRASNAEVYAQILSDLAQAEQLLQGRAGAANSSIITIDAVTALQARVALYMEDWATAYAKANSLVSSSTYALMSPSVENMEHMWRGDGVNLKEAILSPSVKWPEETTQTYPNTYLGPKPQNVARQSYFAPRYLPTKTILDLFADNDTRKSIYFTNKYYVVVGGIYERNIYLITKWWGNPSLAATSHQVWGVVPDARMRPKTLRVAEQYLIAAEAAYRLGEDALTSLNALRTSRGLAPVSVSGEELFQEIQNERRRELAFEGFRLWDIRRWQQPLKRYGVQSERILVQPSSLERAADDPKFVWPLPHQDIQLNSNLKQNQGF